MLPAAYEDLSFHLKSLTIHRTHQTHNIHNYGATNDTRGSIAKLKTLNDYNSIVLLIATSGTSHLLVGGRQE